MMHSVLLQTARCHARQLAEWHAVEWGHLYTDWNTEAALREFEAQNGDGTLPATIIALENGVLLGSVSLIFDDLPGYEHCNPWLASFFVPPEYRKRGVGHFLLGQAEDFLQRNGVKRVYLFTESAGPLFRRHGWRFVEGSFCNGYPVEIMTKALIGAAPAEPSPQL